LSRSHPAAQIETQFRTTKPLSDCSKVQISHSAYFVLLAFSDDPTVPHKTSALSLAKMASTVSSPLSSPPSSPPAMSEDHEQKFCHFMRIPPELRLRIYGYVLKASHPIHSYWFKKPDNPNFAAILQVNQFISTEATPVLYQENTIRFMARTLPVPFTDSHECRHIDIPKRFVPLLRSVVVSRHYGPLGLYREAGQEAFAVEMTHIVTNLATDAPKLESLTYFIWDKYEVIRLEAVFELELRIKRHFLEAVTRLSALKEFVIAYGPLREEKSDRVHVAERQDFPGVTELTRATRRTMGEFRKPHLWWTVPISSATLKMQFSMV